MSELMQKLNAEALAKARASVAAKFPSPAELEELSATIAQVVKKHSQAEVQLSLAKDSKLDALKRAHTIMEESSTKLNALEKSIVRIDNRIRSTNTLISNYDYLRKVHFARDNINKVLNQVEYFANVPQNVASLHETLDSDPTQLKEVFLAALKLDALRQALMKEIRVSKDRRTSVFAADVRGKGDYSEDSSRRIRATIENHLNVVPALMKRIKSDILGYVDRFLDLGIDSPQDLVMALEVVEMYQEYLDRRSDQARRKAIENGSDPDVAANEFYENFSYEVQDRIRKILLENIEHQFEAIEMTRNPKTSQVSAVLSVATQMMSRITEFKNEISPCMPPSYETMNLIIEAVENHLVPQIMTLVGPNIPSLDVSELLKIIDWIEYYIAQMHSYDCDSCKSVKDFPRIAEELMNEYLHRIKEQVMTWFKNIASRPVEIIKTTENLLITSHPEDMFQIIHMQVSVAKEKLPREHLKDVVNACIQVLREVQRQSYDKMESESKEFDAETLCAFINDNQRMQEKCDEFLAHTVPLVQQEEHREVLKAMLEEVSFEYLSLALKAVLILAKCVLGDLEEPVFSKIYTAEWESGGQFASVLTATLEDYFADISMWIPFYYYSKVVKEIFVMSVEIYVMSIRKHANGAFHFMNEFVATGVVVKDMQTLQEFFEKYEDVIEQGGLRSKTEGASVVQESLQVMASIAAVISSTHFNDTEKHAKGLFEKFGVDGLKLSQSIILSNPAISKSEKNQYIDKLTKTFETGVSNGIYSNTASEQFKSFDTYDYNNQKNNQKTTKSRFWGSRR